MPWPSSNVSTRLVHGLQRRKDYPVNAEQILSVFDQAAIAVYAGQHNDCGGYAMDPHPGCCWVCALEASLRAAVPEYNEQQQLMVNYMHQGKDWWNQPDTHTVLGYGHTPAQTKDLLSLIRDQYEDPPVKNKSSK
jgi:hypothetical protein